MQTLGFDGNFTYYAKRLLPGLVWAAWIEM